ncbi:MAG: hypothetical protein KGI94_07135 [Paracoccaceae bacterium]|nr:hypothetical protein [Paracoccaceae bacterium]
MSVVLILGSAPDVVACQDWDLSLFSEIVVINNAWRVREDWTILIHPEDFPEDRRPGALRDGQRIVTAADYVPAQNALGGFVYAGGTMAFTAGYWVLHALAPKAVAYFGCDMVYAPQGNTHFYGTGAADPLRADVTLRSLEAKATRLQALAARQGCALVNLSTNESRLTFPRATLDGLSRHVPAPVPVNEAVLSAALSREAELGYFVESGRYWDRQADFDTGQIDALDALWRGAMAAG